MIGRSHSVVDFVVGIRFSQIQIQVPKSYEYSKLYDKSFSHGFRKSRSKSSKN